MIGTWNIRGLNDPIKQSEMKNLIVSKSLYAMGILETRVRPVNFDKVWKSCKLFKWNVINNNSFSELGRIWITYDPALIQISNITYSAQCIQCEVNWENNEFLWSVAYGSNDEIDSKNLWRELMNFRSTNRGPWLVMGDFNAMTNAGEKIGGNDSFEHSGEDFLQCINDCNLSELKKFGCEFTWTNNQAGEARIWRKLDRALINSEWLDSYGDSDYVALNAGVSDHSPLIVTINKTVNKGAKPFKFFNMWMDNEKFIDILKEVWGVDVTGCAMFNLVQKLKNLKVRLKDLNQNQFSGISLKVKESRKLLEELQNNLQKDPLNEDLLMEERAVSIHYKNCLNAEEKFLKQKSRISWLKLGDSNNKFFHNSVKVRRCRNRITKLVDANGNELKTQEEISDAMVDFYEKLLGKSYQRNHLDPNIVDRGPKLGDIDSNSLVTAVTQEEIKCAMFSINKAPGPDGYSSLFFQRNWNIVGGDVVKAIQEFFFYRKAFEPVIAMRLSRCISSLISQSQCAFIPGRRIIDNVLLAHELVHDYPNERGVASCAMKVDLRKAYDTIEWDFLEELLLGLQFPRRFIEWIMICVRTPRYSVSINGSLYGYFRGGRGIFLRLEAGIVSNITEVEALKLNHLSFADDLFLFCHGDLASAKCLRESLTHFQEVSGICVNKDKSSIFFCNVPADQKRSILDHMEFGEGYLPVKYLGMPLISRRLTKDDCQKVILKITNRISAWNVKYLSYAGRLQLINSILPLERQLIWKEVWWYCLGYSLPEQEEWWSRDKKVDIWNTAAVMKQVWIMLTDKCSLWPHWVIHNKLKKLSYWGITKPYKASWSWRNLVKLRSIAKDLFEYKVGNGRDTYFWFDPWVHGKSVLDVFPRISIEDADIPKDARIADLYRNGTWILPDAADEVTLNAWEFLRNNFIVNSQESDKVMFLKKNHFTIKDTWKFLLPDSPKVSWYSLLWKGPNIPRYSFITWIAIQKGLNTRNKLFRWGSVNSSRCVLCNDDSETIEHLFFHCKFSDVVWRGVLKGCGIRRDLLRWGREISWFTRKFKGRNLRNRLCRLAFCAAVYYIWIERNDAVFKGCRPRDSEVIKKVRFAVCSRLNLSIDTDVNSCWM
ncbi:uncharacterized protein LOC126656792 [Mercurialis annua]|uniref:uncharacterized protein LOC126656792 n=1 Tax=Mercurialis annua TaxID=3986 RepID=UPI00215F4911|nr:uncharacterized protein LOC126656792 [Mercurialis annua]